MKAINEMDEVLAEWVINLSIDDGNFKGPAVNGFKITERSYWLGGEAVLSNGIMPNIQVHFLIGEKCEIQIRKVEFDAEKIMFVPKGYLPINNTSVIIKKLLDEGFKISPIN